MRKMILYDDLGRVAYTQIFQNPIYNTLPFAMMCITYHNPSVPYAAYMNCKVVKYWRLKVHILHTTQRYDIVEVQLNGSEHLETIVI